MDWVKRTPRLPMFSGSVSVVHKYAANEQIKHAVDGAVLDMVSNHIYAVDLKHVCKCSQISLMLVRLFSCTYVV